MGSCASGWLATCIPLEFSGAWGPDSHQHSHQWTIFLSTSVCLQGVQMSVPPQPGHQALWPWLQLFLFLGSGDRATLAASICFYCKACATPFLGVSPVTLPSELEAPSQCRIIRSRLCPQHHCFWHHWAWNQPGPFHRLSLWASGVNQPMADSVLSVFQGSVNKRMSTPRQKGHLLSSGDLDFTWEPGWWPAVSEVWLRSQDSSLRLVRSCWLKHPVCIWSQNLHQRITKEVGSGSRKNFGPGTWVKCVWLHILSCETVTNIIWQETGICMTVFHNRCLTW